MQMKPKKFRIKVRVRKGSSVFAEPFYDTDVYTASCRDEALAMMHKRIYEEYGCFNPEIIFISEV